MCPCRGGRAWEGGEGRVQTERSTRQSPPGQENGSEGERRTQLCRSPDPGRRCPGGCPQQVDRLGHPLARGVARLAPGWLPPHYGRHRSALSTVRRDSSGMPAQEARRLAEDCPRSPWTVVGTGSGLSMQTRAEITSRYARAYAKASKKDKRRGSLTRSGCRGLEPGQRPQRGGRPTPSAPRGTSSAHS